MLQNFFQDLRYGVRMLLSNPGFTLVAVITLALGIGANTAIFSVLEALILRPLPYQQPERLVMLSVKPLQGDRSNISYPNFSDWRDRATSFESVASIRADSFNLTGVDKPIQLRGRTVNWNFFDALGVRPRLGRTFTPDDDRYGAVRTALISNSLWESRFGGDASVIGRKILLDGSPYDVIGVLPAGPLCRVERHLVRRPAGRGRHRPAVPGSWRDAACRAGSVATGRCADPWLRAGGTDTQGHLMSRFQRIRIIVLPPLSVGIDGGVGIPLCQIPSSVGGWWAWGTDRRLAGWSGLARMVIRQHGMSWFAALPTR